MITQISGAGPSYSAVSQAGAVAQGAVDAPSAGLQPVRDDSSNKQSASANPVAGVFSQLRDRQDVLNKVASVVREVGGTIKQADKLLDKMEKELGGVVKMYPPYPIDNPERISMLNNFAGLRKQIESLAFPPQESLDAVSRMLGVETNAEAKKGSASETQADIPPVTGDMWDIPNLDTQTASDAEVSEALDQVETLKAVLEGRQAGMWNDVVSFVRQADSSEVQNEASATRAQLADLAALGDERGIGSNTSQFAQAAESK